MKIPIAERLSDVERPFFELGRVNLDGRAAEATR
jgi:hypothetical protein